MTRHSDNEFSNNDYFSDGFCSIQPYHLPLLQQSLGVLISQECSGNDPDDELLPLYVSQLVRFGQLTPAPIDPLNLQGSISGRRLHCHENNTGWIIRTARVSPTSLCVRLLDVNLFVEIKIRLRLEIIPLCVSHAGLGLPKAALE
ncbi:hypothetical protein RRG08_047494 [Elysia crispata]|uniref:Uncharacterized protein n=1 Tax=Elysia crispata TaxID=231223 RepID=A0AAE0Z2Z6_9GAST|nr:hypothetical protein RRG08_047494 [Elysia crispata]